MFYVTVCLARLSMLPLNSCSAFICSLSFMFFVLSVWCDYRRCRLPVVLYVQAVCVLFVLSVWRDYRRCCLTVVLRLLSRAAKVFVVRFF